MTQPIGRYAAYGPAIPVDGMPDEPPLRILRITELADRNGLGEIVILVDGFDRSARVRMLKFILGVNPHDGQIMRAAMMQEPGCGFVATLPEALPGNLRDIITTIVHGYAP